MKTAPRKVSTGATVIICMDEAAKKGTPEHERIVQRQCQIAYEILREAALKKIQEEQALYH